MPRAKQGQSLTPCMVKTLTSVFQTSNWDRPFDWDDYPVYCQQKMRKMGFIGYYICFRQQPLQELMETYMYRRLCKMQRVYPDASVYQIVMSTMKEDRLVIQQAYDLLYGVSADFDTILDVGRQYLNLFVGLSTVAVKAEMEQLIQIDESPYSLPCPNLFGNNQQSQTTMNIQVNGGNNNFFGNVSGGTFNQYNSQQEPAMPEHLPSVITRDQASHLYEFMLRKGFIDTTCDIISALYVLGSSSEPPVNLRPIHWLANRQLLRELLIPAYKPAFDQDLITQKAFGDELVPKCFVGKNFKPISLHNDAPHPCHESDAIKEFLENDF